MFAPVWINLSGREDLAPYTGQISVCETLRMECPHDVSYRSVYREKFLSRNAPPLFTVSLTLAASVCLSNLQSQNIILFHFLLR
jgi:hypothetical protein